MNDLIKKLPPDLLKKCKKIKQPTFIKPMLATLTKNYFSSSDWIYEHKFDGERCVAIKRNGIVSLFSRNHNSINNQYPELVRALTAQKADNFIIDGEIVALDKKGIARFELLQSRIALQVLDDPRMYSTVTPIFYCIFDLMYCNGYDVQNLPLTARKKLLKKLLNYNKILLYTAPLEGDGLALLKKACKKKWEGLIVKKSDSTYSSIRSPLWLKFKCSIGQELVIGGYTEPRGSRTDFGALLVGYYKDGALQYAGKVGTGFTYQILSMLGKKLRMLEIKTCPFTNFDISPYQVHWVKPVIVAEFEFAEWTKGGKLRVGRYKGLRDDKTAKSVVREIAKV